MPNFLDFNDGYIDPEQIVGVHPLPDDDGGLLWRVLLTHGHEIYLRDSYDVAKLRHYLDEQKLVWINDDPNKSSVPPYMIDDAIPACRDPEVEFTVLADSNLM